MSTRNRFFCLSPHLMQRNPWVLMTSPQECQKMHTALQGNFSVTKLFNQSLHISNSWKFTRIHLHVVQPSVYLLAPKHTVHSCLPPNVNYFCPAHPHTWIYSSTWAVSDIPTSPTYINFPMCQQWTPTSWNGYIIICPTALITPRYCMASCNHQPFAKFPA